MQNRTVTDKIEVVMAGGGKVAAYMGGGAAFIGGMSANEVAAIGGLIVGVVGLVVQFVFNRRRDRREVELHKAQMYGLTGYGQKRPDNE